MAYLPLQPEQAKVSANAIQLFEVLEQHRKKTPQVAGSMHWKSIKGREYLYRAYSHGKNQSLGPRSTDTERLKADFETRKTAHKQREERLKEQLVTHAAYVRANRLNRFPMIAARLIRAMQRRGIPFRIIGTNALYVYEARAGILIQPEHLATKDIDVLGDARQGVKICARLTSEGLPSLLKTADKTFEPLSDAAFTFSAANALGYRVDFINLGAHDPLQPNGFERLLEEGDLTSVSIDSMKWLLGTPRFEGVVFDGRGFPLRVSTVDPRAFVLHKWYVSRRVERNPLKRQRDEDQAGLVARLIDGQIPELATTRAVQRAFPYLLSQQGEGGLDDLDV